MAEHGERSDQASSDAARTEDGATTAFPTAVSSGSSEPSGSSSGSQYYPDSGGAAVSTSPGASQSSASTSSTSRVKAKKQSNVDWRGVGEQAVGFIATVVRWIGVLFALALVLHVVFTVGDANPENGIVSFVRNWADWVSLGFKDLFTPTDAKLKVLVNFGIAAIFWLVVTAIVAKIVRRIGGSSS